MIFPKNMNVKETNIVGFFHKEARGWHNIFAQKFISGSLHCFIQRINGMHIVNKNQYVNRRFSREPWHCRASNMFNR